MSIENLVGGESNDNVEAPELNVEAMLSGFLRALIKEQGMESTS